MTLRPVARATLVLGLLVTACLAAMLAPVAPLPRSAAPEIALELRLPEASDPETVTRSWVEPVEERIRSLGRVVGHEAEVDPAGARWRVVFDPGTDAVAKAGRLEAELGRLRRSLPRGGSLWIDTAADVGGDLAAIVWLRGDAGRMEDSAERVRAVPGVRTVTLYGAGTEQARVEVPERLAETAEEAARAALRSESLGRAGDQVARRVARRPTDDLSRIPVPTATGPIPLGLLGDLVGGREEPPVAVRWRGRPSRALLVRRHAESDPLRVDAALRTSLRSLPPGVEGTLYWSEASSLARMFLVVLAGLVAASVVAASWAALGTRSGRARAAASASLTPWVAAAGAILVARAAGLTADVVTVPALLLGCAAGLVAQNVRRGAARMRGLLLGGGAGLAAAVALAGPGIAPWLGGPAGAFLAGVAGSVPAVALLAPLPAFRAVGIARVVRGALREPMSVLLALVSGTAMIALAAGDRLVPEAGAFSVAPGDLSVELRLPEGATLAATRRELASVEAQIASREETEDFWAVLRPGFARITVDLVAADRAPSAARRRADRWARDLHARGALTVAPVEEAGGRGWRRGSLPEVPTETDDEASRYRFVLRSTDLGRLEGAWEGIANRLSGLGIRDRWITTWDSPSVRLVLEPTRTFRPSDVPEMTRILVARTRPPEPIPLPGSREKSLLITFPERPTGPDDVPELRRVFARAATLAEGRTLIPGDGLKVRERLVRTRVMRNRGRFTMPVEIAFPYRSKQQRFDVRRAVHRGLALERLPAGVDLERPSLTPSLWQGRNLELPFLALAVVTTLLAMGTMASGSVGGGATLLAGSAVALVWTAGWGALATGRPQALLVVGALGGSVLGLAVTGSFDRPGSTAGTRYRRLRRAWRDLAPGVLLAAAAFVPSCSVAMRSEPWAATLQGGGLAFLGSVAAGLLLVPALGVVGEVLRPEARREARHRRHPLAWARPGRPRLEVRSLAKVHSGGVVAVRGVSFALDPGIVGLLGPNGAGKTTLLRMLTGLLEPTRGVVTYRGTRLARENLPAYRRRVGFLPQLFDAYPGFTAYRFLEHWALQVGLEDRAERRRRIEELLDAVGLAEHADRRVRDFSGGMKQRIGVARALLDSPPVLVVDEPTAGLDLESRQRFRELLLAAAGERIVVFSTHIASDLEAVAGRLLILDHGRLRYDGSQEALRRLARGRVFEALVPDEDLLAFTRRHRVTSRVRELAGVRVRAVAGEGGVEGEPVEPNLEEAYLAFLGDIQLEGS